MAGLVGRVGTDGLEDEILDDMNQTANEGPFRPFINDCHNSIDRSLERHGVDPASSPNSRFGLGKPETFDYLGFTHICGKSRAGRFLLERRTMRKRMRAKLRSVKTELMRRMHLPVPLQGAWLASVVRGHIAYYAVPTNVHALVAFRKEAVRHWRRALCRRSQRGHVRWDRVSRLEKRWIPPARIPHPWPEQRFDVWTRGRSPVR